MSCRWKCVSTKGSSAMAARSPRVMRPRPRRRSPARATWSRPCRPCRGVRFSPDASTRSIAATMAAAASWRRDGRASWRPTRSGRSGWRCSCRRCRAPSHAPARTSTGKRRSGLRLPEGAMPIVPVTAGPRSERMSPNRLLADHDVEARRAADEMRGQDVDVVLLGRDVGIVARRPRGTARPRTASCG